MVRVTVIIPTFNRAEYLREAIDSAAAQDDVSIVVADNASNDATPSVVDAAVAKFGTDRLRYVRRASNIGWHANFNESLAEVESEFALVLGDDDRLLPGAMRRAIDALDRSPTAGMAHAAFETIDADGQIVETATDWTKGLTEDTLEPGAVFIERTMPWPTRVFAHSVVMRRAAFQVPMWDPADGAVADYVLWMRIALHWDVEYLATPAAQRRVHPATLSKDFGAIEGSDYLITPDAIEVLRAAKLHFVDRHLGELRDPGALRRAARRGARRDLAVFVRGVAGHSRRGGLRALARAVRVQPTTLLDPIAWRGLAKIALGPRASARLGRARGAR
ncbi:MAG TPA: glycosyltransferase family 2 protein [Acidimicrobiia bacterium]